MNTSWQYTEIQRLVAELCDEQENVEHIYDRDEHRNKRLTKVYVTHHGGLLAQLDELVSEQSSPPVEGKTSKPAFASKPPLMIEALSRHEVIRQATLSWCQWAKLPCTDVIEDNVRQLVKLAYGLDDNTAGALLVELRMWHNWAKTLTGWQRAPFNPFVPCPTCNKRGTVFINVYRLSAYCSFPACGQLWDKDTIEQLGNYVKTVTMAA